MDLRQLEGFVRVAELGSFTRAALALGLAQPALSRQVRLLEVELRQTLLRRHGRGAVPTEAGQLLLEHARGILHQVERAREDLARQRGGRAGRVALGLPPSVARALAVPLMRAFTEQLPQARLAITEALSASMHEQVTSGRLDIAVLYNARPMAGLDVHLLGHEELLLVQRAAAEGAAGRLGPPGSAAAEPPGSPAEPPPATLPDVAALPLVIPSRPNAIRMHVEAEMAAAGCHPTVALEIDGVPAILDLVAGGAGCAILSRNAVTTAARPAAFVTRRIATARAPRLRIPLSATVSAQRPVTRTQQTALDLVRALARAHLQD